MALTILENEILPKHFSLILFVGIFTSVLLGRKFLFPEKPTDGFPLLHPELSSKARRAKWLADAGTVLREGHSKFPNQVWAVERADGPALVIPRHLLEELRKLPESTVSTDEALRETFATKYSTIHVISPLRFRVINQDLTPRLANHIPTMADEAKRAVSEDIPEAIDWTRVNVREMANRVVAKVSGHTFVGPELCRNEDWLHLSVHYTADAVGSWFTIKQWHPLFRPFVYTFIPQYQRAVQYLLDAERLIGPILKSRLQAKSEGGNAYQKPDDIFQCFIERASETERMDVKLMSKEMLTMNFAAINTGANFLTQALYDLAARPEYTEPLREELVTALKETDGVFTKDSMDRLVKLDSFLKEVHTHNPGHHTSFRRNIIRDVTLSDGTRIRAGTPILAAADVLTRDALAHDEDLAATPPGFDGFRWARLREKLDDVEAKRQQFTSLSERQMQFGYGRRACPGRFYADKELKLILANFLLDYEIKMPDGVTERYANTEWDGNILADTKDLLFKRIERQEVWK